MKMKVTCIPGDGIGPEIVTEAKKVLLKVSETFGHEIEFTDVLMGFWEQLSKRTVWFIIDEKYGKYQILMFYDNAYNKANGDDL